MRIVGWVVAVAVAVPLAGWGLGEFLTRRVATALSDDGAAVAAAVKSTGFPTRIGLEITDLVMPARGTSQWQIPRLTAQAPLWAPLNWALDPSLPQQVILGGMRFALNAGAARGGVDLSPGLDLALRRVSARLTDATLTYEAAGAPSLAARLIDLGLVRDSGAQYRLDLRADELALPPGLAASLTPRARLPDAIDSITLRADLGFAAPMTLGGAAAELNTITLSEGRLVWGGHALDAEGALKIDKDGLPVGELNLATRDWQAWLEFLIGGKLVDDRFEQILTTFATYLASQSKDGTLRLPLAFRDGLMNLGPVPLGPAPRLR